mgnify:CR=1 FL=1
MKIIGQLSDIDSKIEKYLNEGSIKEKFNLMLRGVVTVPVSRDEIDDILDKYERKIFWFEGGDGEYLHINKGDYWYKIGDKSSRLITDKNKIRKLSDYAEAVG